MKRNNDFWEKIDARNENEEDEYEMTAENEYDSEEKKPPYLNDEEAERIRWEKINARNENEEDEYEMTAENEYDSEEKKSPYLNDEEAERIRQRYGRVEREFKATFSYAYDNCRRTRHDSVKVILATTPTVEQGKEFVRTKLLINYPNLDINSIIHKED